MYRFLQTEARKAEGMGTIKYTNKAFTERFGFDNVRISQVQNVRQRQSNGERPLGCFIIILTISYCQKIIWGSKGSYIHRCGAFALLVSTNRAMREPLHCGTGNR